MHRFLVPRTGGSPTLEPILSTKYCSSSQTLEPMLPTLGTARSRFYELPCVKCWNLCFPIFEPGTAGSQRLESMLLYVGTLQMPFTIFHQTLVALYVGNLIFQQTSKTHRDLFNSLKTNIPISLIHINILNMYHVANLQLGNS